MPDTEVGGLGQDAHDWGRGIGEGRGGSQADFAAMLLSRYLCQ